MANPSAETRVLAALAVIWAFFGREGGRRRWALLVMLVLSMGIGGSDGLGDSNERGILDRAGHLGRDRPGAALGLAMQRNWPSLAGPTPRRGGADRAAGAGAAPSTVGGTAPPPPASTPWVPTLSAGKWRPLVCSAPFTWPCEWALAVIQCESSGNPDAYNPAGPYMGLFQVLNGPYDPGLNAVEGHIQFVEWQRGIRAVSPWPGCP